MSIDAQSLFKLLPAILRIRDQAQAVVTPGWLLADDRDAYVELRTLIDAGIPLTPLQQQQADRLQNAALAGPLASLLAVFAEQLGVLQEDLAQLYDDQFIETCADWAAPYIGDLIGYRMLHGVTPKIASPRAEVAHTIAYRRRKGTVIVLEQLARDVTGWNATAVEFFQKLVMTQYMNHRRPQCLAAPDLRQWQPLERLGTAFDSVMHTVDVRRIGSRRGRYNIPNVGLFLWRLDAWPLTASPAVAVDERRWRFHPLGIDQPLYTHPQTLADFAQLSTPLNVPLPISRRVLAASLADYYSSADAEPKSLCLYENSGGSFQAVDPAKVRVCNLDDLGGSWAHLPSDDHYVVDPLLGRIALPPGLPAGTQLRVDFHYGFSGALGGGEYERVAADAQPPPHLARVPQDYATIQAALNALGADGGVVEIGDSGRYAETLAINAPAQKQVELRAANGCRPTLVLSGELALSGGDDAGIRLDGLLITGAPLHVADTAGNRLARLVLAHCTLVPGLALNADSSPQQPGAVSLIVEIDSLALTLERTISGALRVAAQATVAATDSIIDATAASSIAYAAVDGSGAGGALQLKGCTVVGKLNALKLPLVSNSILLASLAAADTWGAPVIAQRRQEGCVRFSYLPDTARVPRRYRCLPESAASPELAVPRFTSLRYGFAAYAQLAVSSGAQLLSGADNEGQPGAFNFLFQPQRETNLRMRLDEYLRVGLQAGILYES
ncbi:MAG: hypothetical protein JWQ90_3008 [Hydrocarboniphaga sp.]|uniref:hypothetical protein n=1 Tax=Hydrocarboniphaga sp. TaxID=2033016 RepID=UPI0026103FA9|nr:hypothetical protein [Hydrocarboniphaga sp.]MDB5970558.1 hypothetical protein [Hydrocarboniphaga sp.]